MSRSDELIRNFAGKKVLVIGDMMLDAYYWGKVNRISPEAPVPVVFLEKREFRLGGAANVGINIQALGAIPILCSFTGKDESGEHFLECMKLRGLNTEGMIRFDDRKTTIKRRIIGNNHQLIRIDEESEESLTDPQIKKYKAHLNKTFEQQDFDVVIIEDYDKGAIDLSIIELVTELAASRNIPVTVDPKKNNFKSFKNIRLFKPNLLELTEGLQTSFNTDELDHFAGKVKAFIESRNIESALVTLSEKGVFYINGGNYGIIPAHIRNIADVSGAGDTVISVASLCVAVGLDIQQTAALSNLAGGLVCEKVGVVPVDLDLWKKEVDKYGILN